jgi:tRNA-dihydrouridine synthase B
MMFAPLQIGQLSLANGLLLSPMEAVSCVGFRRLCHQTGAGLTYTEMIRARGIVRNNKSTIDLIDCHDPHTPTGLQLMTTGPAELADALTAIETMAATSHPHLHNLCAVDLNFGCPSPEVIRVGAGPAMLKRRARMEQIFQTLRSWQRTTKLPIRAISCKIRLGLNQQEASHKIFLPIVELASQHLDAITVHARHAGQKSRDAPTWSAIGEAKRVATIPVIGNGDVVTRADAQRLHNESGCDGVMIARAAIKNPWRFGELLGRDAGAPTAVVVDQAATDYQGWAERCQTKEKFRLFHSDNFARLRQRAQGQHVQMVIPKTLHLS